MRRRNYVLQRLLALAVLVTALTLVLLATVALGSLAVDLEISFARLVSASVSVGLLALLFGTAALAAGAVRSGRARAIAVAAGLAVASWMFDGLAQAVDALGPGGRSFLTTTPWGRTRCVKVPSGAAGPFSLRRPRC